MKRIKWIIVIIVILIIILSMVLVLTNNKIKQDNKDEENVEKVLTQEEIDQQENDKAENIPPGVSTDVGYDEFFTISNCISQYLDVINKNNSSYYGIDDNGNSVSIISEEDIIKRINDIKSVNSNNNIQMISEKNIFTLIDVAKINQGGVNSYAAHGFTMNLNNEYLKDMYFIVNLDTKNITFSIEQLYGNYSNLSEITTNKIEKIEKNENNQFIYQQINDQYKYKEYLLNFKKIMLCKPELAYQYLDEEYKKERFETYNDFYNYIQENKDTIKGITAKRYKTYDDNKKVIITDQNSNKMTFNITGTMKYTVSVDNYIVLADSDIEEYNKFEDNEKAEYNIKRWLKMINNKDYKYAYKFLDDTFKNEKYGTEEEFEQFIKNKYPDKYEYSISNLEENGNIYSAEVKLYTQEEFSEKYLTIIIKSNNDASFSVSFDIQ